MSDTPSIDSQVESAGNSIVDAIKSHYGSTPIDPSIISDPTKALSYRIPEQDVTMPTKTCNLDIDFLNTYNDLNVNKSIKSMSLDPIIKRLIQEKNDILRAIEGWVASQANDGARQPQLATTITKWVKKAIGYMRCGLALVTQIDELISGWITAILAAIDSVEQMISKDIAAVNLLMNEFQNMGDKLKKEGETLVAIALVYELKDFIALFNEIDKVEAELNTLKAKYSKDHLKSMQESLVNSFLSLIDQFKRMVNSISSHQSMVSGLNSSITSLKATKANIDSIDLSIPTNPGGVNPGALSNYTITNDGALFSDFDSLTQGSLLNQLNQTKIYTYAGVGSLSAWTSIFSSNEVGYVSFSANSYGIFQLGVTFDMPTLCPGAHLRCRLVINGGDWILESNISGNTTERDDTSVTDYATKNAVFTKVPLAPNPTTRISASFNEFISAINRPACFNTLQGQSIADPTNPGSYINVPTVYNNNGDYYVLTGNIPNLTVTQAQNLTSSNMVLINALQRYLTQSEINFYESQYNSILQAINISPTLYNPKPFNPDYKGLSLTKLQNQVLYQMKQNYPSTWWSILNAPTLNYTIYEGVTLTFRMPFDSQVHDHLFNNKPFSGIQIYTTSIILELSRQVLDVENMPYFADTGNSLYDAHVVSFGLKADWGFAPIAQLS